MCWVIREVYPSLSLWHHLSLDFAIRRRNLFAMRIHFLGATRTTTGSVYLFELNGQRLLLECGLFQGRRGESIERNRSFPFDPKQINAVVLSHAHIDHCGNLPNLCRQGFGGNIYCTFATRDLAEAYTTVSRSLRFRQKQVQPTDSETP